MTSFYSDPNYSIIPVIHIDLHIFTHGTATIRPDSGLISQEQGIG